MSWDEDATQVFSGAEALLGATWQVNLSERETRSMTAVEIGVEYGRGLLGLREVFVWRDGMPDWIALGDCAELKAILEEYATRRASAPAAGERAPFSSSTAVLQAQHPAAAVMALAGRSSKATLVGLGIPAMAAPYAAAASRPGGFAESSGASPPRRPPAPITAAFPDQNAFGGGPGHGSQPAGAGYSAQPAGFNYGSQLGGAGYAVPPAGFNYGSQSGAFGAQAQGPSLPPHAPLTSYVPPSRAAEMAIAAARLPQSRDGGANVGLVVGFVAVVLLLGSAAAYFMMRAPASGDSTDSESVVVASDADPTGIAPIDAAASAPATGISATAPATDSDTRARPPDDAGSKGDDKKDEATSKGDDKKDEATSKGDDKKDVASGKGDDKKDSASGKGDDKKDVASGKGDDKKVSASGKGDDKKDSASSKGDDKKDANADFNVDAAKSALEKAAGAASGCGKSGGPTGRGKATVTFAASGAASSASVNAPFAGTPTGSCAVAAFRRARVPPFSGSSTTVTKSFIVK
ncbi:MAG: hypothetical protein EXR75_00080 [Myxococcales bacterium]|nr:hypothetical protein [Myxococcales bacterium]